MTDIEFPHIDLTKLVNEARNEGVNYVAKMIVEEQEQAISDMTSSLAWRRAGTYRRTLVTGIGTVVFRAVKLRNTDDGRITTPILDMLDIRGIKYSREVRMKCADLATRTSYGNASDSFRRNTGIYVPKRTIHSFVQEIGREMEKQHRLSGAPAELVQMADGTKTHGLEKRLNDIRVAVIVARDGSTKISGITVNSMRNGVRSRQDTSLTSW